MEKACPICGKEIYLGEREIGDEFIAYEVCPDEKCGYEWEIYRTTDKGFFEAFMWVQEWALDKGRIIMDEVVISRHEYELNEFDQLNTNKEADPEGLLVIESQDATEPECNTVRIVTLAEAFKWVPWLRGIADDPGFVYLTIAVDAHKVTYRKIY